LTPGFWLFAHDQTQFIEILPLIYCNGYFCVQIFIMPLLELQHLRKYFATQKAVDDISLTIEQGQIFGLLGPNGAGKTTLIRMITGIFYPDEGQIIFDGKKGACIKK
jgi:ABC-type uncharacterized transport system ATPase subunit